MADRKIVEVEETKTETKKSGLKIDLGDLKKIGVAILAFVAANPDLVNKLIKKPAAYLKKIVKGEDVSKETKKTVNQTIKDNKSGGLISILGSLTDLSGGDAETDDIFGKITKTVKGAKVAESAGLDVGGLLGGLLGGSSKKSKKSSSGLGDIFKSLFK
jgi:hypothetical protein